MRNQNKMTEQQDRYETYWIEYPKGNIIEHSCNPRTLNNICVNDKPEAPFDVTPVYFSRDVLSKFYNAPHKYNVSDGEVYYKEDGLFLRVDTDMKDYVAVLLVDFAMLDYKEQQYWASFNVSPEGKTISKAAYNRWYEGKFECPVAPDAILVHRYSTFYTVWNEEIGWPLFLEDPKDTKSVLYSIHMLSDEHNEKEFYDQVLNVTKLFVDSLNVNHFPKLDGEDNKKSISRFVAYLDQYHLSIPGVVDFMRNVQRLRSSRSAHSGKIEKKVYEYFEMDKLSYGFILNSIYATFVEVLNCLQKVAYKIKERQQ